MPETPETLVVEGKVTHDDGEPFLETDLPNGKDKYGYYGADLLGQFEGRRVRVTIEIVI